MFHAQHSHVGTCVHVRWFPSTGAIHITHAIVLLSSIKCRCGTVFTTAVPALRLAPPLSSPCPSSHSPHVATAATFLLSSALFHALFVSAVLLLIFESFHTPIFGVNSSLIQAQSETFSQSHPLGISSIHPSSPQATEFSLYDVFRLRLDWLMS